MYNTGQLQGNNRVLELAWSSKNFLHQHQSFIRYTRGHIIGYNWLSTRNECMNKSKSTAWYCRIEPVVASNVNGGTVIIKQ